MPSSVPLVAVVQLVGQVAADSGDDASQRLSWVILGLVGLAVVISIATVVFWRLTRPDPQRGEPALRWVPDAEVAPPPVVDGESTGAGHGPSGATSGSD